MHRHGCQHKATQFGRQGLLACAGALMAVLALAFSLAFCLGTVNATEAQAAIYPANSAAADDASSAAQDENDQNGDEAEDAEVEAIEDEDTPLSDGLGGAEPIGSSFSFGLVAAVGIAAVVAFFMVLFRRLNGSIRTMNRMFK